MQVGVYTTLFLGVGGVLLTNGWDRHMREQAAHTFHLDYEEMNKRHALVFDTYEIGKMTLDEYLKYVVFYQPRHFSVEKFKDFIFAQSQPYDEMLQLIRDIKTRYSLRTIIVSNEGREIMIHRIKRFFLREFIDFFVCSGFVGLRKPDKDIYRLALDLAQVNPQEVIYIDDRPLLIEIGNELGIQSICHLTIEHTLQRLQDLLLVTP